MDKMNIKTPSKIRIKDIAIQAGVSTGTVDRVLHGRPNVSEESRAKVEEILKRINYQPNRYASALASNKSYCFEFLMPEHQENDYWSFIEKGIQDAVLYYRDFNINIGINYYKPYNPDSFLEEGNKLLDKKPEGVVVVPTERETTAHLTTRLNALNIPFIFLDSTHTDLKPLAFFGQDPRKSGYFAANMLSYMTEKNAEVTIFKQLIAGRIGSNQQMQREEGFREYFKVHRPDVHISELNLPIEHPERYEEELDNYFRHHKDSKSGITFFSRAFYIGEYLSKHPTQEFYLVGYDLLEKNRHYLKEGFIEFLITQHPNYQGFSCVKTLVDHMILKKEVECNHYMPIELLSVYNVDFYQNML